MWRGYFFSRYFTPNKGIYDFQNKINCLENEILAKSGAIVVAGDFNAMAVEGGLCPIQITKTST